MSKNVYFNKQRTVKITVWKNGDDEVVGVSIEPCSSWTSIKS